MTEQHKAAEMTEQQENVKHVDLRIITTYIRRIGFISKFHWTTPIKQMMFPMKQMKWFRLVYPLWEVLEKA